MPTPFQGIYTAVYGYKAQSTQEITFEEGDILCVLDRCSDDDWWKAKKKGDSLEDDEPVGLVPTNYIEEVCPNLDCGMANYVWSLMGYFTSSSLNRLPNTKLYMSTNNRLMKRYPLPKIPC
jgi:hypothetical protein